MATADEADKPHDEAQTAGQRLAAAKAAKAARKAAKRGRQAELVEGRALKHAETAGQWARRNRRYLITAVAIIGVVAAGAMAWTTRAEQKSAEASRVLWEAVETARAQIQPEGAAGAEAEGPMVFATADARAERAAERYKKVIEQYPSTEAAVWAQLGRGNALYQLDQWDDARQAYEAALSEGGADPIVAWRALEGLAFTFEAEEKWDEAAQRFEELGTSAGGAYRDIADYHLARMQLAEGNEAAAKETLRALVERLRGEREDQPELEYVLAQAELRLGALDSSLVPRPRQPSFGAGGPTGAGGPGGVGNLSPEQLQQLIERLKNQAAAAGEGAGAGAAEPPGEGAGAGAAEAPAKALPADAPPATGAGEE